MAQNQAAWLTGASVHPFRVQDAPYPTAGPGEVVIQNAAVAINPVDWKIQSYGIFITEFPSILGEDAAGVVVDVGPGVTRFTKGQRVLAYTHGLSTKNITQTSFQKYSVAAEAVTAAIPDSLSFEQASVLPLAVSTASAGLFQDDHLALPFPSVTPSKPTGKTLLVWGGASSVGAAAVQLAAAAGLNVISTASAHNHELVKSIGASAVFDYNSPTVVDDIASALASADVAGVYDAISLPSSFEPIKAILEKINAKVGIATVLPYSGESTAHFAPTSVHAASIVKEPHKKVSDAVWRDFVTKALENGHLKAKPDPEVVGKGLGDIQKAVDLLKKGVSAKKLVVTL
ncbi:chaperonin 10-like protein [Talaromyces proteolyticus]|uniref:Chaperonin 10-like protein n=1 Tax=Talaromyces proteolyticus TaxID=1131652 RepID=A0AAD4KE96_9EURO|nr:chaperonin 10-like protein [Talaromyces proteolyticus]KAH8690182.1 chaperonin 10-like protein [Talaromyces proteolyticus]